MEARESKLNVILEETYVFSAGVEQRNLAAGHYQHCWGCGFYDMFEVKYVQAVARDSEKSALNVLINDLLQAQSRELSAGEHRAGLRFGHLEARRKEDLISCLKSDAQSIDTGDKKNVRTLKAFKKEPLERDESRI